MKKSAPTQREVAKKAGVSRSTVTRALRDDPQISLAERERIRGIAEEMGYRPNPMINALMEQLRTGREARFQSVLAWAELGCKPDAWKPGKLFEGASTRARELGYVLEPFFPGDSRPEAFLRMLRARGIRGLLIEQSGLGSLASAWDFADFCAVTVGFRFGNPALHFVMNDWFAGVWSLLHRLWAEGFRRPALALDTTHAGHKQFRIIGGYEAFLLDKVATKDRIPPWRGGLGREKDFPAWIQSTRPDALIIEDAGFFDAQKKPKGLPVFAMQTAGTPPGLCTDEADIGRAATDLLTAHLLRNDTGIPKTQKGVMIEPALVGF